MLQIIARNPTLESYLANIKCYCMWRVCFYHIFFCGIIQLRNRFMSPFGWWFESHPVAIVLSPYAVFWNQNTFGDACVRSDNAVIMHWVTSKHFPNEPSVDFATAMNPRCASDKTVSLPSEVVKTCALSLFIHILYTFNDQQSNKTLRVKDFRSSQV